MTYTVDILHQGHTEVCVVDVLCSVFHRFTFTGKERDSETGYGYFGARYMDHELLTMWLSIDPMADKYPQISSYNYCIWNPIRIIDPDGRDGWDKIAGICIGFVTNVVPGTSGLRDTYFPTNITDYNSSLRAADNTTMVVGGLMAIVGTMGAIAGSSLVSGGAAIAATGIGAPEGAAVAATGAAVDATSAIMGAGGAIMTAQAASNSSQGYNRGGDKDSASQPTNKEVAREAKKWE